MRISQLLGFGISLLLFSPGRAVAQSNAAGKTLCQDAKTQLDLNQCFARAWQKADAELNALYQSVKRKLDGPGLANLLEAQRTWIKYRDANCEGAAAQYEGGSIQPMIRSACLERVTRARVVEIHAVYDSDETRREHPTP